MSNFDHILEEIGPFGRYQAIQWLVCFCAWIIPGTQSLLNVFLEATPEYRCTTPEILRLFNVTSSLWSNGNGNDSHVAPPIGVGETSCVINPLDYSSANGGGNHSDYNVTTLYNNSDVVVVVNASYTCTNWEYDYSLYGTTAVTKWDLVCTKSSMPAVAQAVYMLGFLLGTIVFGYLSDRLGRKSTLMLSVIGSVIFGATSAFMPGFWSHMAVRMITGVCASGVSLSAFVQGMENIGISQRLKPAVSIQMSFAFGYMSLAPVAYLIKDFVWTNFTLSVCPLVVLGFIGFLPESPRWLMANGRYPEAAKVLRQAAKINGKRDVDVDRLIDEYSDVNVKTEKYVENANYTLVDLLKTPNMRKKTLLMFYSWFVVSLVYFGLTTGSADLGGSPYLNLFISGVMECLSVVVTMFILDRVGRRICLAISFVSSGMACVICGLLPPEFSLVVTVMSMIGKFAVSSSFSIVYVFAAELFPTVVRTVGVGGGSMSARIGGLLAPFVAETRHWWRPLPTVIFGCFSLTAGGLSLLFPETLGQKLPETLQEGEQFGSMDSDLSIECQLEPFHVEAEDINSRT